MKVTTMQQAIGLPMMVECSARKVKMAKAQRPAKLSAQHFKTLRSAFYRARPEARPLLPAKRSPWLLSLRSAGCLRALRRSKPATMAHEEVSNNQRRTHETPTNSDIAFHPAQASLAAANLNMPALSPTMTEGNIATWKIKEGTTCTHTSL